MGARESAPAARRRLIIIFAAAALTYGYFMNDPGVNGYSRLDLVWAMVEDQSLRIDRFHRNTIDKAYHNGHYYSDKAPGSSLVALPVHLPFYAAMRLTFDIKTARGLRASRPRLYTMDVYLCTLAAAALPTAVAAALMYLLTSGLGATSTGALFASTTLALGTIAFTYATLYFGHQLCGAMLFLSFTILALERRRAERELFWRRWPLFVSGFAAGYAVLTEFPAAVPAALFAVYLLWAIRRTRDGHGQNVPASLHGSSVPARWSQVRAVLAFFAGAAIPAAILAAYNLIAFGGAFDLGYSHEARADFAEGMARGVLGVTRPNLDVLRQLVVGHYRGLFTYSPVLLLAIPGAVRLWRRSGSRAELVVCVAVIAYYLLMNSSYYLWWGGWAIGPRHLAPMLPFLVLPTAFVLRSSSPPVVRGVCVLLLLLSVANMLAATAVDPILSANERDPLYGFSWSHLVSGKLGLRRHTNVGAALGLPGAWSLAPLLVLWALAAVCLLKSHSASQAPDDRL